MAEELRIDRVRLRDEQEKDQAVIEIELFNPLARTVHVHATPRMVHYDPATRHLAVEMSDQNLNRQLPAKSLRRPKFKALDPQRKSTMRVRLRRIMHQLAPGADPLVPGIATLRIYEASEVEVTLAWSDTPFYPDPRDGAKTPAMEVAKWQKGTVHGRGQGPGAARDPEERSPA